jgi:hypothetical protein
MRRFAKWMGLTVITGLMLLAGPGTASAAGWRGGGSAPAIHGGHLAQVGGWRGAPVAPAPVYRGGYAPRYVTPGYAYPRYVSPGYTYPVRPVNRVYVPGYWNWSGGTRVWVGGAWAYPPYAGWAWVAPHWAWNGYAWVWETGHWAPPY